MAHSSPLGHRADAGSQSEGYFPARWQGKNAGRSHFVAWRRSGGVQGRVSSPDQSRSGGGDCVFEVIVEAEVNSNSNSKSNSNSNSKSNSKGVLFLVLELENMFFHVSRT